MPQGIPQGFTPPADGVHVFAVRKVETQTDSYGKLQEVVECAVDPVQGQEEKTARLFFPHQSKKWFDQGVSAGIIGVSGEYWEVIPGSQCRVLVQNGKTVSLFKL